MLPAQLLPVRLCQSVSALALGLALLAAAPAAFAQSVTGTGDVDPTVPGPPLPDWNLGGASLTIGNTGTGMLTIENGGTVSNTTGYLGASAGGTGTVTVTGTGSTWTNTAGLVVGDLGTGTLTVANGGKVSNTVGVIGYLGSGTATVTGANSTWTNSGDLYVGWSAAGRLTIENGGTASNVTGYVGNASNGSGTVTVTGAGSTWSNTGELHVGNSGTGTLTIADGGKVTSTLFAYVGSLSGSTGTVTVTGAGSRWSSDDAIVIGYGGTGTLTIEKGGMVTSGLASIGAGLGTGTVTVTGAGSTWTNVNSLSVGISGTGTLNIENGGSVTSRNSFLGVSPGGTGTVTVTGTGSTWSNSEGITVGWEGTGTLTVSNGGKVSALTTTLATHSGSSGTLNLLGDATNGRGVLETGQVIKGAGTATLNLDGGILRATRNEADYLSYQSGFTQLTLGANGVVFDSNGHDIAVSTILEGTGGLTKTGAGTLSLTGNNAYAGGTTVLGGKLAVGSDANLGAASGGLTLDGGTLLAGGFGTARAVTLGSAGGTIEVASGQVFGHSGTISGAGGLTKDGTGQLALSGTSTYSGATTVSAGTLHINGARAMSAASNYTIASGALLGVNDNLGTVTAGSIAGAGQIRIESGSTLETGATHASTSFTGMIYDAGSIRKVGTGTLTLTQENSYAGGTTIAGGAISISRESNLGSTSGALTLNGGVLQVTGTTLTELNRAVVFGTAGGGFDIADAGNSFTLSQSFSGTGAFSKAGAGTLLLKSTQSYSGATTVSGGTLRAGQVGSFSAASAFTVASGARLDLAGFSQSIGSLAGAGMVTLGAGTLTAGSDNSSTGFAGSITGSGGLTKAGAGTLTLSGASSYAGSTQVQAGKLVVNGSLASAVTLAGGTLGGSGTVGAISVGGGATVAPGNSIGTLTVSGNVAFASGSIYQVEVNAAGQSDRIVASGLATLAGGTVAVLAETGNYAASTNYTILTAAGGVSGQFANVTSNLAFLTPSLSYGATSVTLTMARNQTGFATVALTRNQGLIANAAERLSAGNPVYDTLLSSTAAEARAGFDLLSGEAHAQAVAVMIDESRLVRETILSRLRGPLLTAPAGEVAAAYSADLPGRKGAVAMPAPLPQSRYAFWGEAFGGMGNSNADGNAASQSRRSGGALLGADMLVYDNPGSSLRLGLAGGYSQSRFDLDARLSSGRLESGHAGLYAGARFGSLRLDMGAAYSWSESDIRRQVAIRGFGDVLHLQRPGSTAQAFAELGHGFAFQGFALEPFAQLALIRVSTDAGTEQGGAAALRLFSSEQTLGFSTLGLRAEAQLGTAPLFARAMLGWRHGFGDLTPVAKTAFLLGSTPAQVYAAAIDRNALATEAGLDWRLSSATSLGLTYSAAIGERSRYQALKGRVDVRF
ncbi:extracellular serine protease precursor [Bosea sp. BIWAKO-01]|nr:extracellular serine protease precursor [Bosea sp. BIWAKO-01]